MLFYLIYFDNIKFKLENYTNIKGVNCIIKSYYFLF